MKEEQTNKALHAKLDSVIEKSNAKRKLLKKILTQLSKDIPSKTTAQNSFENLKRNKEKNNY